MKTYEVTIVGEITVEADNEFEAERMAVDEMGFCFDSYQVESIECFDDEDNE